MYMIAIDGTASINVIIIVEISGMVDDGVDSGEFVGCGVDVGVLDRLSPLSTEFNTKLYKHL